MPALAAPAETNSAPSPHCAGTVATDNPAHPFAALARFDTVSRSPIALRFDFSGEKLLDREQVRQRLQRMTDAQLRRWGASARYMCSPEANLGQPPRQNFVLQLGRRSRNGNGGMGPARSKQWRSRRTRPAAVEATLPHFDRLRQFSTNSINAPEIYNTTTGNKDIPPEGCWICIMAPPSHARACVYSIIRDAAGKLT
jgi:hypothetical protein